jgi:histidine ammonia-lyase
MKQLVILDTALTWEEVAAVARGASLGISEAARARLDHAHRIVLALIAENKRVYGVTTGVGALADVVIPLDRQAQLSRNILMSHAAGVGAPLPVEETRAVMAASINNLALGYSGVRAAVVDQMILLLNAGCTPEIPRQGSVGYISHRAHLGLVLIGHGYALLDGERLTGAAALARLKLAPLVLEAKEGLSLVNGSPCATGLACLAVARTKSLMDWADAIAAMSFETQRCQLSAIDPRAMALRASPGVTEVTATLNRLLEGSELLAAAAGRKTQDALSLRGIPQVHGAIRDAWADSAAVVARELCSVTDNPIVTGTPESPEVYSEAHAISAPLGLAMDHLAVAVAQFGNIAERRIDRMVNALVSGLPAFLAADSGVSSGFMIAQYTAVSLVAENRRLAAPASLDGGVTSGLQEDFLSHATPAALKTLAIVENVKQLLAIELLAACQSYDLLGASPAAALFPVYQRVREAIPPYADDRPLGDDFAAAGEIMADCAALIRPTGHAVLGGRPG